MLFSWRETPKLIKILAAFCMPMFYKLYYTVIPSGSLGKDLGFFL